MVVFFKKMYERPALIFYIAIYLSLLSVLWTGITLKSLIVCFIVFLISMWGATAGHHRYFSHKSFSTSRIFQFILAFIAQTSTQKGILWWAEQHRLHHANSDTPADIHSPRHKGFFYAHVGWIFTEEHSYDYKLVKDWQKFPELVWLDKYDIIPTIVLGVIIYLILGWQGFVIGFCLSRILCWDISYSINSLAHCYGSQRFETNDDSRNNFWLALLTLGEGWHNNHHYYASSARHGFYWWEIDFTYYTLRMLSFLGIVWDLKTPSPAILAKTKASLDKLNPEA